VPDKERFFEAAPPLFAYEETLVGPEARTAGELVEAVLRAPGEAPVWAERYRAFRERFTPRDDGHAAQRTVQAINQRSIEAIAAANGRAGHPNP
jgi:hypothetical protein